MPLPLNGVYSLQGYSRPGDTIHSKPKQAMIIRMSTETLQAIESFPQHPQMHFEFGENPKLYIGDTTYPLLPHKEEAAHELYLRTSSAAKPMAPLKHYANITGKFTVERQFGEGVREAVRGRTVMAESKRMERKVIVVDTPPDLSTATKKKKQSTSMFRKPVQQVEHLRTSSAASTLATASARVASPMPSQGTTKEGLIPVRKRLIHCLAVSQRLSDEIVRLVGGADCDAAHRRDILELLADVAEQITPTKKGADRSTSPWRLKTKSWIDVRPFEWPKLTESERVSMARQARIAFNDLNIPESDPAWDNIRYRATNSTGAAPLPPPVPPAGSSRGQANGTATKAGTSSAAVSKTDSVKRGVSSKDVKEKKAKTKAAETQRARGDIQMKDESVKASAAPRVSNTSARGRDHDDTDFRESSSSNPTATKPSAPARRVPGSGFRVKSQDARSTTADDPSDGPPRGHGKPVDVRMKDREPPMPSVPARPAPPIAPPVANRSKASGSGVGPASSGKTKRVRELVGETEPDRERVKKRERGKDERYERERDSDRNRESDRDMKERNRDIDRDKVRTREKEEPSSAGVKRKLPRDEDAYEDGPSRAAPQKKRRTEEGARPVASSVSKEQRPKDVALPKKPDAPPPRSKIPKKEREASPRLTSYSPRKEATPLPPPPNVTSSPSKSSTGDPRARQLTVDRGSSKSGSSKSRRVSAMYTSSEDEGEIRRPIKHESPPDPLPTPPNTTTTTPKYPPHQSRAHSPPSHRPRPLSTSDHLSLRARYDSTYLPYLSSFQKIAAQKRKVESMLKHIGNGSIGSITDSDGDVELMNADELAELTERHRAMHEELNGIRQVFAS